MAEAGNRTPGQFKDALLEYLSRDVKAVSVALLARTAWGCLAPFFPTLQLQALQCDVNTHMDAVTENNEHSQSLCEHLDLILTSG